MPIFDHFDEFLHNRILTPAVLKLEKNGRLDRFQILVWLARVRIFALTAALGASALLVQDAIFCIFFGIHLMLNGIWLNKFETDLRLASTGLREKRAINVSDDLKNFLRMLQKQNPQRRFKAVVVLLLTTPVWFLFPLTSAMKIILFAVQTVVFTHLCELHLWAIDEIEAPT